MDGQQGTRIASGEESGRRRDSPAATSGAIPAAARAGVAGEGSGRLPGTEAEPPRWILVGVVRRSCNSTAVQRSGGLAEQNTRRARVWAARGVDRVQGVRPGAFKGGMAGDLGVRAGERDPR